MSKSIVKLVSVLLIIAILGVLALNGLTIGSFMIPSVLDKENGIRRGLDLVGGSVITYEAQIDESMEIEDLAAEMDVAVEILRTRLNNLGYAEAVLSKVGETRIRIEIPSVQNPEEAVQTLGSTAQLEFYDSDGNVIMVGSDIKDAKAQYGQLSEVTASEYFVSLEINPDSVSKFVEATKEAANKETGYNYIAIVLDGQVISAPAVSPEYAEKGINSDIVQITGGFTMEEAVTLANLISSGQLPFSLKDIELRSVGPTLGEKALETCLLAALIGLVLVAVFMIVIYRLPGIISVIALCFYTVLVAILLAVFKVNLSLPGFAGIILSIGMAVDANVIIFERIKEELRMGKLLRSAIASGFKRAFTAIVDSNVTTLIAAVVLYFFGTGTIVSFALTLGIGVIVSMFTAIVVTKFLTNCLVGLNIKSLKAFGL